MAGQSRSVDADSRCKFLITVSPWLRENFFLGLRELQGGGDGLTQRREGASLMWDHSKARTCPGGMLPGQVLAYVKPENALGNASGSRIGPCSVNRANPLAIELDDPL